MEGEQFLLVLPSNSSMRHFPNNTTSSFSTELPHAIVLHGEWEVAISEIQFPCTFLHVRHNENVIRFVDVKPDEETMATIADGEAKVGPVNHLLHSMFNQIDVYFNQKFISPNNAYAYRAYIERY